jgi:5-formyltetrahydrofolate cyclo-ligase
VQDKKQLRAWAKQTRATLPITSISQDVVNHLQNWKDYQHANNVLSYLAFGDEIDLSTLHQDSGTQFYVTRTHREHLTVHPLENLEQHLFGYWQPAETTPVVDPEIIDLVLVPGLCFDKHGFRLGYGKGYYDKLLPKLRKIPFVGITAHRLILNELPREWFDIAMTHLVTETGMQEVVR